MIPKLAIRLITAGALAMLFYSCHWGWLRAFIRDSVATLLGGLGHHVSLSDAGGGILLVGDNRPFEFTANCTYADLMLIITAFLWRFELSIFLNVIRAATWLLVIFIINILRITLALHLNVSGFPWEKVHDMPDIGIHCAVIFTVVYFAIRNDSSTERRRQ